MSTEILIRGFFLLLFSSVLSYVIYDRSNRETSPVLTGNHPRYMPYMGTWLLPAFLLCFVLIMPFFVQPEIVSKWMLSMCLGIFIHISIYYVILLLFLPVLRKYISARTCAALWLLPNYLYFVQQSFMVLPRPKWILRVPEILFRAAIVLWAAGFAAVLGWKLFSHFSFRNTILKNARDITDPAVLEIWQEEQRAAGLEKKCLCLVRSPQVQTPLSIGFFHRTMRVVLPERQYSNEELRLILRHEIIHIGREDSCTKFFLVFCTAMCWFNPLMWTAMQKSADDLELSCDETVLLEADEGTRRQYADLLLRTAGDERGFTTCLSASAEALRYRLKHVIKPQKRFTGGIIAGLIFFVLLMTYGYIAFAHGGDTGAAYLFQSGDLSQYPVQNITRYDSGRYRDYSCRDETALNEYLSGLHLYEIMGNYSFPDDEDSFLISYYSPEGAFDVSLHDGFLTVTAYHAYKYSALSYCFAEEIDWEYLNSLLISLPDTEENALPFPPQMCMYFNDEITPDGDLMYASGFLVSRTVDGTTIRGSEPEYSGIGGVSGFNVDQVKFFFSHDLCSDGFTVQVENWEHTSMYQVNSAELAEPYVLPLAPYSAHYTVYADLTDGNTVYEMQYQFDIELP